MRVLCFQEVHNFLEALQGATRLSTPTLFLRKSTLLYYSTTWLYPRPHHITFNMAITSKTANERFDSNPHPILADVDPFFQFMDFTFTNDELNEGRTLFEAEISDTPNAHHNHPSTSALNLDDLPSPTPFEQIFSSQYAPPPTTSSMSSGIHQPKIAAAAVVSADGAMSKSVYDHDDRTNTAKYKPDDVLSIRGRGSSKHPGNLKFRSLVASKKRAYDKNACLDHRRQLADDIVTQLLPGRFLKKADASQRLYQIMDYQTSVTKALFAIRDVKVPTRRATATNVTGKRKRSRK